MSIPYSIPGHSQMFEGAAWLGIGASVLGVCFSSLATGHQLYGAISPQEASAWVTTICGAVLAVVNTGFVIYHRIQRPPRRRKRRAAKIEGGQESK